MSVFPIVKVDIGYRIADAPKRAKTVREIKAQRPKGPKMEREPPEIKNLLNLISYFTGSRTLEKTGKMGIYGYRGVQKPLDKLCKG